MQEVVSPWWVTVALAVLAAIPTTLIATARAIKILKSSLKDIENKAEVVREEVKEATKETHEKLDRAESKQAEVAEQVSQKIDENTSITKDLIPTMIAEVNDRIDRHKLANLEQNESLRKEFAAHIARLEAQIEKLHQRNPMPNEQVTP